MAALLIDGEHEIISLRRPSKLDPLKIWKVLAVSEHRELSLAVAVGRDDPPKNRLARQERPAKRFTISMP
jgi:hypothetical protein